MRRLGTTPPFRGLHGERVPGSIAETRSLRLGGLEQWVMIRGESLRNPPLLYLSGGPGMTETQLFRHFNGPLERHFTAVYWDQRGSGKSYHRDIPASSMTVAQFLEDLDELVETVCRGLGKKEVVLYGHSWGSALGVLYAARFPQKVAAYVASGQIGDALAGESASYAYALARAEQLGDRRSLQKLRAIGPPPYSVKDLWTERTTVQRLEGQLRAKALWDTLRVMAGGPEGSLLDLPSVWRGWRWSLEVMWPEVSRLELTKRVTALQMPVFFFLGRKDRWVPPETSVAYFEALTAPSKELLWFERSGHLPFADEPDKFNAAMVERVRPVVLDAPATHILPGASPEAHAPAPG